MPSLEDLHHPDTVLYRNGRPYKPIDILHGCTEDSPPKKKYSTRKLRRMHETARQRFEAEPTSFEDAREKGLNYYWDSGE